MTEPFYELQDSHGRNVGECFDSTLDQSIDRARAMQRALPQLGRLRVVRVVERVIRERIEVEISGVEAGELFTLRRAGAGTGFELEAA